MNFITDIFTYGFLSILTCCYLFFLVVKGYVKLRRLEKIRYDQKHLITMQREQLDWAISFLEGKVHPPKDFLIEGLKSKDSPVIYILKTNTDFKNTTSEKA